MQRRLFLTSTATTATALGATGFSGGTLAAGLPEANITGVVTLYTEFRVTGPAHEAAMAALQDMATMLKAKPGFLSFALKQMSGESTMTKNYPVQYKGVLAEAYLDGVKARTQPFFYALFVRFSDYASLRTAKAEALFSQSVLPHLHAFAHSPNGPVKSPQPMAIYQGVFQTVAAGNRKGVYNNEVEIKDFLRQPVEIPASNTVTVANHVMVAEATHLGWEVQVASLLKVAQETFQPLTEPQGLGLPGAPDNRYYRKALSTEILRNAFADGPLRAYLMHGVWDSVWDHENSHLDPRFNMAAGPVGAGVEIGPLEPFYLTRILTTA
jgi:hypothetical protein